MERFINCLCALICSSLAYGDEGPAVRTITLKGNHFFTGRQLMGMMATRPSSMFSAQLLAGDISRIGDSYRVNGYYFADVRADTIFFSEDSTAVDLFIGIDEGDRVIIDSVCFAGNALLGDQQLRGKFETRAGQYLIPGTLESDINSLLSFFEQSGYPFATVEISDVSAIRAAGSTKLRIDIFVDEGRKVTIDDVKISGNKHTNDDVILREARLKPHEIYDRRKISRIAVRLNRLDIFSEVDEPEPFATASGGGILIKVREGNANTFSGIVGYAPGSASGGNGIVTGIVHVSMRNLFGTARKFSVRWLRDELKSQETALSYFEPWVLNFPVNLAFGFNQRQQDTFYVKRGFDVRGDILITESLYLGGSFQQDIVIPSGSSESVLKSRTTVSGIDIRYDTRDDILSPRSGIYYGSGYRIGRKSFSDRSVTVQRISFDTEFFLPSSGRQVAVVGLHGRSISSPFIEIGDLYRFGGTNTLRGYRENQFLGSRIAWTNAEYRYLLARRSYFFGFFDTGYYFLPGDDAKNVASRQKMKYGYGIGLRLDTVLGNIGLSFAFGEDDSFLQGKVHIGIINEF